MSKQRIFYQMLSSFKNYIIQSVLSLLWVSVTPCLVCCDDPVTAVYLHFDVPVYITMRAVYCTTLHSTVYSFSILHRLLYRLRNPVYTPTGSSSGLASSGRRNLHTPHIQTGCAGWPVLLLARFTTNWGM